MAFGISSGLLYEEVVDDGSRRFPFPLRGLDVMCHRPGGAGGAFRSGGQESQALVQGGPETTIPDIRRDLLCPYWCPVVGA